MGGGIGAATAAIASRNPTCSRRKVIAAGLVGVIGGALQGLVQGIGVQQHAEMQMIACRENALYLDEILEKYG
jgi:hypothetical protein